MDESYSPNYVEYTYEKKPEGKMILFKYLLVLCYILFVLAFFLVCYITRFIPLFAICPLVTWILVYFTWHFVSYDVYYTFEHGEMEFGKIKKRKRELRRIPKLKIKTQSSLLITTYSDAIVSEEFKRVERVHDFSITTSSTSTIVIIYEKDGVNEAVILETTPKLSRLLTRYSKNAKAIENI